MFEEDEALLDLDLEAIVLEQTGVTASSRAPNYVPTSSPATSKTSVAIFRRPVKRRLPGPAGVETPPLQVAKTESPAQMSQLDSLAVPFKPTATWMAMRLDQDKVNPGVAAQQLMKRFNIDWVTRKTCPGTGKKVPVLYCALRSLDQSSDDPKCELEDPSGRVAGMIHRDVMDSFGPLLGVGTVLVLKNVHVIMNVLNHYVMVTLNNLVHIYHSELGPRKVVGIVPAEVAQAIRNLEAAEKKKSTSSQSTPNGSVQFRAPAPRGVPSCPEPCSLLEGLDDDSLFGDF